MKIIHIAGMEKEVVMDPLADITYRVFVLTIGPECGPPDIVVEGEEYAVASQITDALNFLFDDPAPVAVTMGRRVLEDGESECVDVARNIFAAVQERDAKVVAQWKEA